MRQYKLVWVGFSVDIAGHPTGFASVSDPNILLLIRAVLWKFSSNCSSMQYTHIPYYSGKFSPGKNFAKTSTIVILTCRILLNQHVKAAGENFLLYGILEDDLNHRGA